MADRVDLALAQRLADEATPGPWQIYRYRQGGGRIYVHEPKRVLIADLEGDPEAIATAYHEPDREFLLACRSLVPALVAELVGLREATDRIRQACQPGNFYKYENCLFTDEILAILDGDPNQ